jgi:hypothetical protein
MVERVNGTIKNDTILKNIYRDQHEMTKDLARFLLFTISTADMAL